jgi:hypothetical protein
MASALRQGTVMPNNNPEQNEKPWDEARDERRRRPPSHDQRTPTETKSRRNRAPDEAPRRESHDTDPDSPDADIDRDDMIDEA